MIADTLNAVRWTGKRHRNFYEAWFLTVVDPATGDSFWFRYTVDAPSDEAAPIQAGLWAFSSSAANPKGGAAAHDAHALARFVNKSSEEKGFRVEVGPGFLERTRAKGKCGAGANAVEWDLTWEPKAASVEHVSPALEVLGLASSSVNTPHAGVFMTGTIKVAGKSIKLDKAPGEQGHTWGRRRADKWAWAHCNAFAEDAGAVFGGVSATVHKFGFEMPTATPLYLRLPATPEDEEYSWTGPGTVFANRSSYSLGKWEFEAEASNLLMKGTATVDPAKLIAVEYADPSGEKLYCHHATGGDLVLELYRRVGARWSFDKKLTSKGTTAVEFADRTADKRAGRQLLLADTKVIEEPKPAGVA